MSASVEHSEGGAPDAARRRALLSVFVILATVLVSVVILGYRTQTQQRYSALLRAAGTQQRHCLQATLAAERLGSTRGAAPTHRTALTLALDGLERGQHTLGEDPRTRGLYTGPPHGLDRRVQVFVQRGRTLADVPSSQRAALAEQVGLFGVASSGLLDVMERATASLEHRASDHAARSDLIRLAFTALVTLLSTWAVFAVFAPLLRQARDESDALREMRGDLEHWANHDALTGLPNRRHFQTLLDEAVQAEHARGAIVLLDLDFLKDVNDLYGHATGDAYIETVAKRIAAQFDAPDFVARLGGDEFAAVLLDASQADAMIKLNSLIERLEEPTAIHKIVFEPRVTVGLAMFPEHHTRGEQLMQYADLALNEGKKTRRGQATMFMPWMQRELDEQLGLARELDRALELGALSVVYTPRFDLRDGHIVELLAEPSWRHTARGEIDAATIRDTASRAGLSVELALWLTTAVARQLVAWRGKLSFHGRVALNLGDAIRRDGIVEELEALITACGAKPSTFRFEFVEDLLAGRGATRVHGSFHALAARSFSLGLHDFGMGYAALRHVARLPVDQLVLDSTLTRELFLDRERATLALSIIRLSQEMGVSVIANGAEEFSHIHLLSEYRCDHVQGPLFGTQMDAESFGVWWRYDGRAWTVKIARLHQQTDTLRISLDQLVGLGESSQSLSEILSGELGIIRSLTPDGRIPDETSSIISAPDAGEVEG